MNTTSGRLSKELQAQEKMNKKLQDLPEIFRAYYNYLRAERKSYSTLSVYINNVIHFAKFVTNNKITNDFYKSVTIEQVESYIISLETTVKNGQIVRTGTDILCSRWSSINTFFEFLTKRNYVEKNPVAMTSRPKNTTTHETVYLDKKEIKKLLSIIDNNPDKIMAKRDKMLISLGIATGLRCSAIVNINISDINFDENYIQTVEKGNKIRKINIGDNIKEAILEWIDVRNQAFPDDKTGALFISNKYNRLSPDAANDALKKYAKEAGITKKVTMHKLRSSAATNLAASGVSLQAISKILGHSNPTVTMRYVEVLNKEQKEATNILDKLF